GFEPLLIQRDIQNALLLAGRKTACQIGTELGFEQGNTFLTPPLVPDGVFAHNLVQYAAVVELDSKCVGNRAFLGVVVVGREAWVFYALYLVAQGIDARVAGDRIFVVGGGQTTKQNRHSHHVLNAVVAIGRV